MELTLEKFVDGQWLVAAKLWIDNPEQGIRSSCRLEYDPSYALKFLDQPGDAMLSVHFPINFNHFRLQTWPAFLLDILPSGFGREILVGVENLRRPDGNQNDTEVLRRGAGNPVGNVRVKEAYDWLMKRLPAGALGWKMEEMRRHDADFIEYAHTHGTLVAGTSTQGQAAKMLLTRHRDGRYYADTLVADQDADEHFLMKMPRNEKDAVLIHHEWMWLNLAIQAGLKVRGEPVLNGDLLLIPRFDRQVVEASTGRQVFRRHMESAFSLMQIADFGAPLRHESILEAFIAGANPNTLGDDLIEYLLRDILGYCLRVEDNHGRNTAFLITEEGLELSPLFDFAPMFLTDDPPARSTRWATFDPGEHAQWPRLFEQWLPRVVGEEGAGAIAERILAWTPTLREVKETFVMKDRDQRTVTCEQKFDVALEVLEGLDAYS